MKKFVLALIVLLLTGCSTTPPKTLTVSPTFEPTRTQTITPTPQPSATPTLTQVQITIARLQTLGFSDFEIREGEPFTADGNPIRVDVLDVITAPSDDGLTWWNTEIQEWVLVDPINPDTYPAVYFEHWNNLPTRTPVKLSDIPTEDIAFNDFQIETYQYFFPSLQSTLNQDPLWQSFFQDNGSDFSTMSAEQIHHASLLYGQTSKEIIMPIVLLEQQNQDNPDNWKFTYETNSDGVIFPAPEELPQDTIETIRDYLEQYHYWGFNQNFLGVTIFINSGPISRIRGMMQTLFRIPGVDPNIEVGLVVSFDNKKHLDLGIRFQDIPILPGDPVISYQYGPDRKSMILPSQDNKSFPPLADRWNRRITRTQLQENFIGTLHLLDIGQYNGDSFSGITIDIFSKYSGLQLVGIIW